MSEKPPQNWMAKWEQEQDRKGGPIIVEATEKTQDDPVDHIVNLIKSDFETMLYDIGHGKFSHAESTLLECQEKYKGVSETNPELLIEIEKVQALLEMAKSDLKRFENGDPDDK